MSASASRTSVGLHQERPGRFRSVLLDFLVIGLSLMVAYLTRFEGRIESRFFGQMLILLPAASFLCVALNWKTGAYRLYWRYVGLRDAVLVARNVLLVSCLLAVIRLMVHQYHPYLLIPYGIIAIYTVLAMAGLVGVRFLPRIVTELRGGARTGLVKTLFYGAGSQVAELIEQTRKDRKMGIDPVGLLGHQDVDIHGVRKVGTPDELESAVRATGATQIIVCEGSEGNEHLLDFVDRARGMGVAVRTVPSTYDLLSGSELLLREIQIEDILSRDPVPPSLSMENLKDTFAGKVILVTGAGGSIGSELARQLAVLDPKKLVLLERDETNLFHIESELRARSFHDFVVPVLADITQAREMDAVVREHRPQVVFHAAAYKHVPMMERFPFHAVRTNIFGTQNVLNAANDVDVEMFVLVSTDKAVRPSSVMGASKRIAELLVQRFAENSAMKCSCVRFGNVLGSRGSVLGIFREQIAKGGPVTVTHPEACRYFMTIPEASNLVIQAGTLGDQGEVFLLDMGEPVKIMELARKMIRLSGSTEETVPIKLIGNRPGEKLFEELRTDQESIDKTALRKIFRCSPVRVDAHLLNQAIERMDFLVRSRDGDGIREMLLELPIEYRQPEEDKKSFRENQEPA